jgi:hypothetical protein
LAALLAEQPFWQSSEKALRKYSKHRSLLMSNVTRYRQYLKSQQRDESQQQAPGDTCARRNPLRDLLQQLGLTMQLVDNGEKIPGSFWGDEEAGLIQNTIYGREDTPVHSFMHEACHYVCMDEQRRANLHTNAGGTSMEENAVCYLQLLLADALPGYGRANMFKDMDTWGYSFRLGSAERWFNEDAEDARQWLESKQLLKLADKITQSNRTALS